MLDKGAGALIKNLVALRPVETDAKLEARLEDAAGMNVDSYLADYGPALLPGADAPKLSIATVLPSRPT